MKTSLLAITLLSSGIAATSLNARPEGMPPPPDPETVVVDLFAYDADENNSLSQEELLTGLREIRNQHRGARGQGEGRKGGQKMGGRKGQGPEGAGGPPEGGKQGKRRGQGSPDQMGSRLIEQFDTTGDGELNPEELLNAVTAMHERRGSGRRGPAQEESPE